MKKVKNDAKGKLETFQQSLKEKAQLSEKTLKKVKGGFIVEDQVMF